jgi:anion-transporting  ArsA/GET3 family ATPase
LTVDPAPRLGTALGLAGIGERPQRVEVPRALSSGGTLDAFRLDTRRTFDRVVERLAPNMQAADAIMENPIYRALAGAVGGSEAYMALQRLYELREENAYDVLVIDTPPAVHADDLLSAPARLAALIETDAAKVLANPAIVLARAGSKLAKAGAAMLLPLVERATGLSLRSQVADFISNFESILVRLSERADDVERWLASPEAGFVVVTRPSDRGAAGASELVRSLAARSLGVDAVIVNRLSPDSEGETSSEVDFTGAPAGTDEAVRRMEGSMKALRTRERAAFARIGDLVQPLLGTDAFVVAVESLEHDVGGVADLIALGNGLVRDV